MKTIILQLSDLHISNSFNPDTYSDLILMNVNLIGAEAVIVILNGDIVDKGFIEGYKQAKLFIDKLKWNIKEKRNVKLEIIIVPGNHDIKFTDKRNRSQTAQLLKNEENFQYEFNCMSDYFEFASEYGLFISQNKFYDVKTIDLQENSLVFVMLNSSPFSVNFNGESSKELHYFPDRVRKEIETVCQNVLNENKKVFFVSHHEESWFDYQTEKWYLDLQERYSTISFFGHSHRSKTEEIKAKNLKTLKVSGGQFNSEAYDSFNLVDLEGKNLAILRKFIKRNDYFASDPEEKIFLEPLKRGSKACLNHDFFVENLKSKCYSDIYSFYSDFVFPDLILDNSADQLRRSLMSANEKISSLARFNEVISDNYIITLVGEQETGKTTLLKNLSLQYYWKGFTPVYLSSGNFNTEKHNFKNLIKNSYSIYYNENILSFLDFFNGNHQRILVIDDCHLIEASTLSSFIRDYINKFEKIFLSYDKSIYFDYRRKLQENSILDDLGLKKSIFEVQHFFRNKRTKLIEYYLGSKGTPSDVVKLTIDNINKLYDKLGYFADFTPSTALILADNLKSDDIQLKEHNVYNSIFERDITNQLNRVLKEADDIEKAKMVLEKIAYEVHFNVKTLKFNEKLLFEQIDGYNSEYKDELELVEFITHLVDSKLLKKDGNGYYFKDKKIYAYFVACSLVRAYNDGVDCSEQVEMLTKEIFKQNNSDILMFVAYITKQNRPFKIMLEEASAFFIQNFNTIFDYELIRNIGDDLKLIDFDAPRVEDHVKRETDIDEIERRENRHFSETQESDEDLMTDNMKIIKSALNYIHVIGTILSNFGPSLKAELKDELVTALYHFPNLFLGYLIAPLLDDSIIYDLLNKVDKNESMSRQELINAIEKLSKGIIYTLTYKLYDHVALISTTKTSFKALKTYKAENDMTSVQKLFFYNHLDEDNQFFSYVDEIYESNKKKTFVTNLVNQSIYDFLIKSKTRVDNINTYQEKVDKYFQGNKKISTKLLLYSDKAK